MTKKDYIVLARIIAQAGAAHPTLQRAQIATDLADHLAPDNAQFDRARFLKACEIEGTKNEHR